MSTNIEHSTENRREFLVKALAGLGITLCAGAAASIISGCESTVNKNPIGTDGSGIVELDTKNIQEFAALGKGIKRVFRDTKGVLVNGGYPVIVTKIATDSYVALTGLCTHESCYDEMQPSDPNGIKGIVCTCHGSIFNYTNGAVIQGPAKKPLKVFATSYNSSTGLLSITVI